MKGDPIQIAGSEYQLGDIYSWPKKSGCFVGPKGERINIGWNVVFNGRAILGQAVSIGDDCVLGDYVLIGGQSRIEDNVSLFNHSNLGVRVLVGCHSKVLAGSTLEHDCTIGPGSVIGEGSTVCYGTEMGRSVVIPPNSWIGHNSKFKDGFKPATCPPWIHIPPIIANQYSETQIRIGENIRNKERLPVGVAVGSKITVSVDEQVITIEEGTLNRNQQLENNLHDAIAKLMVESIQGE
jgi:carbonic anhydrase/acetyltransferase-like protein (isoleucine patch superfamily)